MDGHMSHTCTTCGTKESKRWRGMREGRVRCDQCYSREGKAKRVARQRKRALTQYDMWEG